MKAAAIIVQKIWKGYSQRRRYIQMKSGYMRLQALIRARVLSQRLRHLRGHIVGLQSHMRGFLVRREYGVKMWAILKIQSHIRKLIAMKRYKKLKLEYRRHNEALRMRKLEEDQLKRQGNKRAQEIAEKHYLDRLNEIERREHEIEMEERRKVEQKKNIINDAARKQDEPVDDQKLVEAMFDFLPDSSSEAPTPYGGHGPSAFNDLPNEKNQTEVALVSIFFFKVMLNNFIFISRMTLHCFNIFLTMMKICLSLIFKSSLLHTFKET